MRTDTFELYIHIPFCVRKCGYCDFLSFPAGKDVQLRYLEALKTEIRDTGERLRRTDLRSDRSRSVKERRGEWNPERITSIFIGGGTPSVLTGDQIAAVMDAVRESFLVQSDAEITIEANPGTLDPEKLRRFRAAGINRISIGCQSMHDRELVRMGRIHSHAEFLQSYQWARQAGFDNINVDLIAALPGQTLADWRDTLHTAAALGPEHISAYNLILEEGTPFYEQRDTLDLPDEDTERAMYEETASILAAYGYRQYELSNYAKPGMTCRHNQGYWTGIPYLGMGLGAASYWPADAGGWLPDGSVRSAGYSVRPSDESAQPTEDTLRTAEDTVRPAEDSVLLKTGTEPQMVRYNNTSELQQYLAAARTKESRIDSSTIERLSQPDCMAEFMILGLRMTDGISKAEFRRRFDREPDQVYGEIIRKYQNAGLLQCEEDRIFLTGRGRSLANVVMMEFL
ncbi:MAG: radical SAM family heme chaperone HemW [Eubacterium sp.]|nr:radical SAM family heme chaperone HemW [Eubacterium sp.]